jgi:hypothetical protein
MPFVFFLVKIVPENWHGPRKKSQEPVDVFEVANSNIL